MRIPSATLPLLLLVPTLLLPSCGSSDSEAVEMTFEERVANDDRLEVLLAPCSQGRPFQQDTSDMVRVLADKLVFAQLDPLRHAKQELANAGEAAVEDLTRVFDSAFSDNFRQGVVTNVLDCCALMDGPWGLELAKRALDHPSITVRLNAFDVFSKHGDAGDYDDVALFLPITIPGQRDQVVDTMIDLDPARVAKDLAGWVREGQLQDVWKNALPAIIHAADQETALELRAAMDTMDAELEPFLNAMVARHGIMEGITAIRANLVDDVIGMRQLALTAVGNARMQREALVVLQQDPVAKLRFAAAELIGTLEPSEEVNGWLEQALNDVNADVRVCALGHLLPRGHQRAQAETLLLLQGSLGEREDAVRILRRSFEANPGMAEKAFEILSQLYEGRQGVRNSEVISYLQAIGSLPLPEAAEFLMTVGDEAGDLIGGMPGHRWAAIQAFNTGPKGVAVLEQRLATETDLFRRLDLLHSIWQREDQQTRELLLALAENPETSPYERLYVAEKLVRIGPATEIAPRLKRVYLASDDVISRRGLQCLLWAWYG